MSNMKGNRTKMLCIDLLVVMIFLAIDQFTKYLSIVNLKGKEPIVLINRELDFDEIDWIAYDE